MEAFQICAMLGKRTTGISGRGRVPTTIPSARRVRSHISANLLVFEAMVCLQTEDQLKWGAGFYIEARKPEFSVS
jgi:hypothetical protein